MRRSARAKITLARRIYLNTFAAISVGWVPSVVTIGMTNSPWSRFSKKVTFTNEHSHSRRRHLYARKRIWRKIFMHRAPHVQFLRIISFITSRWFFFKRIKLSRNLRIIAFSYRGVSQLCAVAKIKNWERACLFIAPSLIGASLYKEERVAPPYCG